MGLLQPPCGWYPAIWKYVPPPLAVECCESRFEWAPQWDTYSVAAVSGSHLVIVASGHRWPGWELGWSWCWSPSTTLLSLSTTLKRWPARSSRHPRHTGLKVRLHVTWPQLCVCISKQRTLSSKFLQLLDDTQGINGYASMTIRRRLNQCIYYITPVDHL